MTAAARAYESAPLTSEDDAYESPLMRDEDVNGSHPGILIVDAIEELGITPYRLAKSIGISQTTLGLILTGRRGITADTGALLDRYFGSGDGFWYRMQADYDDFKARHKLAKRLAEIEPIKR